MLFVMLFQALTASALSGLRWTLAQILTQKAELGIVSVSDTYVKYIPVINPRPLTYNPPPPGYRLTKHISTVTSPGCKPPPPHNPCFA